MLEALADFIRKLTFVQAQILIVEIIGSIGFLLIILALWPKISGAKKINVKTGETEYYDDAPPKRRSFGRKVVKK